MTLGSLNTNQSWDALLLQMREELDKWGVTDYHLPYQSDSVRKGEVAITMMLKGKEQTYTCKKFTRMSHGAERNLCALKETVRAVRLADQRGILELMVDMSKLAALNSYDPWRVLGAEEGDLETARRYYHEKLKLYHPDNQNTGSRPMLEYVQKAGKDLGL